MLGYQEVSSQELGGELSPEPSHDLTILAFRTVRNKILLLVSRPAYVIGA